jgi:sterol desaturase/sphingolipid hydroxylase (fatty acid hydroxylase superfamily)
MKLFYILLSLFFILGSLLEYYFTRDKNKNYYSLRDFKSSLFLMFSGLFFDMSIKMLAIYLLLKLYDHSIFSFGYQWWVWILCYITWDLVFYLKHYMEHNVRFMWAIHVNHHSSSYMNLSTSLRSGVFKSSYRYFFWAIPIFIGFPVPVFLILWGLAKIWAFFSHSQQLGNWGIFEKFTITPTHHLVHHSCNENNLNKNFGETLLFWDKLFGTFKKTDEPLLYGINEPVNHNNFKQVVFHEFINMKEELKKAKDWKRWVKIIFGKPGYVFQQEN